MITYAKAEAHNPDAVTPRKIKDIPKTDWIQHGFSPTLTLEQAKAQAKSLNAQSEVKRWAEKRVQIRQRLEKDDTSECAFLPELIVQEFEKEMLFEKMCRGSENIKLKSKVESHWRKVKAIIREISLPPKEWKQKAYRFYNHFEKRRCRLRMFRRFSEF